MGVQPARRQRRMNPVSEAEDPRVTVLMDPLDDVRVTVGLLECHDPVRGRVVVHPTPAPMDNHVFAHDLLAALGRPVSRLDDERLTGAKPAWAAAAAGILADQVQDLVVLRADRLTVGTWSRLLRLRRQTGHRLTLVCHRPQIPAAHAARLVGTEHQVLHDLSQVQVMHDRSSPTGDPEPSPVTGPNIRDLAPIAVRGVAHYRAEAFRTLDPAALARFDAAYRHGFDAACGWLSASEPEPARPSGRVAGPERVQSFLAQLVHQSPTRRHTLALLRGAQAGFFALGMRLTVPAADDLLHTLSGPGLNTVPVTAELVDRIRTGVPHPVLAAALAAILFTGTTPRALLYSHLTVGNDALRVVWKPSRPRTLTAVNATAPDSVTTAIFHIPRVARPLLMTAHHFAEHISPRSGRRPFTTTVMTKENVQAAAVDCRIILPDLPADLAATWQIRSTCTPVDAPAPHLNSPQGRELTSSGVVARGRPPSSPSHRANCVVAV